MTVKQLIEKLKVFNENSIIHCTLWGETYSGAPMMGELTEKHITTKEYIGLKYPVIEFGHTKEDVPTINI